MFQRIDIEIDIQVWPMKVGSVYQPNVIDCRNRRILEPGVIFERQEEFPAVGVQPNAVPGDILDFNSESVFSRRGRFHLSSHQLYAATHEGLVAKAGNSRKARL